MPTFFFAFFPLALAVDLVFLEALVRGVFFFTVFLVFFLTVCRFLFFFFFFLAAAAAAVAWRVWGPFLPAKWVDLT